MQALLLLLPLAVGRALQKLESRYSEVYALENEHEYEVGKVGRRLAKPVCQIELRKASSAWLE